MTDSVEAFTIGAVVAGLLRRTERPATLRTRLMFESPHGQLVELSQRTTFRTGSEVWDRFSFNENGEEIRCVNARSGIDDGWGSVLDFGDAVPSYAAHRVLARMLGTGADETRFRQFDESATPRVEDARFVREKQGLVAVDGVERPARRIRLYVGDRPGNSFWVDGASILRSDWNGAQSYPVEDVEALLPLLPLRVRERSAALLVDD